MQTVMLVWATLVEWLALLALVVLAFAILLRRAGMDDALPGVCSIVVASTLLIVLPQIIVCAWFAIPIWQRVGLAILGAAICYLAFRLRSSPGRRS